VILCCSALPASASNVDLGYYTCQGGKMNTEKETPALIVYGCSWCPDVIFTRRYLDQHQIIYDYFDIDKNKTAMNALYEISGADWLVPTIVFPDGTILINPSNKQIAEKMNLPSP
jgi:mycoredoxin